jgi:hypothetical protein
MTDDRLRDDLERRDRLLRASLVDPLREQHSTVVVEPRDVTAGGLPGSMGARVQPAIERYLRRGQLTVRQAEAARRLYALWALGIEGVRQTTRGCSAYSPAGYTDEQIDSATAYRRARDLLGARLWPLVFAVVVEDFTVERFANERGRNSQSTLEVLRYALDTLGDGFGMP